ncbi:unnamed protein product [Rhizoctonia solani]|uniref:Uncharacterized protein n=1 Tax=Rhizoctonia solani TaxID=456999 RepID=A0A8H3B583_9AGAM|nr:unnamed protein product [Rhizoctonia solani]
MILSTLWPKLALEASLPNLCTSIYFLVAALAEAKSGKLSILDIYVLTVYSHFQAEKVNLHQIWAIFVESETRIRRPKLRHRLTRAVGLILWITHSILWSVWLRVIYSRPESRPESSESDSVDTEYSPCQNFTIVNLDYNTYFIEIEGGLREVTFDPSYLSDILQIGTLLLIGFLWVYRTSNRAVNKSTQKASRGRDSDSGCGRSTNQDSSNNDNNNGDNANSSNRNEDERNNGAERQRVDIRQGVLRAKMIVLAVTSSFQENRYQEATPSIVSGYLINLFFGMATSPISPIKKFIPIHPILIAMIFFPASHLLPSLFRFLHQTLLRPLAPSVQLQHRGLLADRILLNFVNPLTTTSVAIVSIAIFAMEKTIAANNIPIETNTWAFGQITALCPTIVAVIASLGSLAMNWREERKEKQKEEPESAQRTDLESGGGPVPTGHADSEAGEGIELTNLERTGNQVQIRLRPGLRPMIQRIGERKKPRAQSSMRAKAENIHVFTVLVGDGTRMWRGNGKMWRIGVFVLSRDPALSFSPQPPPRLLVTMDSLSLLRESLPNAKLETAEREMSLDFKAAAQSLATLFKSSKQTVKHAHDAGYAACLQDMLQIIQSGVSEDTGVGVARVMDWAEGQLDRYGEGQEFEKVDDVIAGLPRRQVRDANSPRRASSSTLPDLPLFDTTASKRRHGAITSVENRRRSRAGPLPGERDIRTPRKVKRVGPGERERVTDAMEFDDDGGRDRKRSKTNSTPPS